tara:strand:+ start:210 stop:380 length:171 start_codon:yes stop_codon:yes gene_type:complete
MKAHLVDEDTSLSLFAFTSQWNRQVFLHDEIVLIADSFHPMIMYPPSPAKPAAKGE